MTTEEPKEPAAPEAPKADDEEEYASVMGPSLMLLIPFVLILVYGFLSH